MNRRRHIPKVLGLMFTLALSFFMLLAAGAQANWLVGGVELKVNKGVLAKAHSALELNVASHSIEFRCANVSASGVELKASSAEATGKMVFSGCKAYSPIALTGTEQKNCNPVNPIEVGFKASLLLHNGVNYVLFAPNPSTSPFTTIEIGLFCALAETSDVTGSLVAQCGRLNASSEFEGENCNVAGVTHLIKPALLALFTADSLKFGANGASFAGIAAVELSSKESWAGHI